MTTCKNITNTVIKLHATNPRMLANLLVKEVKLTKNEPLMGAMGGLPLCQFQGQGPGNTLGERLGMGRGSAWGD